MKRLLKQLLKSACAIALLGAVAACSTPGGGSGTVVPDDSKLLALHQKGELEDYVRKEEEQQAALIAAKLRLYQAEKPVTFGTEDTGYTMLWDKFNSIAHIYPGHQTSSFGIEQEGIMTLRTDQTGRILYAAGPGGILPVKLLANVATQEGMGRVITKGFFQLGSSAVANTGAALINKMISPCNGCGGGGGNQTIVNAGAFANAASQAITGQETNVTTGCNDCGYSGIKSD